MNGKYEIINAIDPAIVNGITAINDFCNTFKYLLFAILEPIGIKIPSNLLWNLSIPFSPPHY